MFSPKRSISPALSASCAAVLCSGSGSGSGTGGAGLDRAGAVAGSNWRAVEACVRWECGSGTTTSTMSTMSTMSTTNIPSTPSSTTTTTLREAAESGSAGGASPVSAAVSGGGARAAPMGRSSRSRLGGAGFVFEMLF